jgi:dipeptidyl aminopeptidase/acylaminoacyl peptidase
LRNPETYACAVAGAPVTSWRFYVAHYAERYLGSPSVNQEKYNKCDLVREVRATRARGGGWGGAENDERKDRSEAPFKKKKLLVAHGASDENVHLLHTARFVEALRVLDHDSSENSDAFESADSDSDSKIETDSNRNVVVSETSSSFEVLVFERERHVPRGRDARRLLERRVESFLDQAFEERDTNET